MAISRSIEKKVRQQAVVKWVASGGGSNTLNFNDICWNDEVCQDQPNAVVTITGMYFNNSTECNITRAGTNVLVLAANQSDKWDLTQQWGIALKENSNANIVCTFSGTGGGTVILVLSKSRGFVSNSAILQQTQPR